MTGVKETEDDLDQTCWEDIKVSHNVNDNHTCFDVTQTKKDNFIKEQLWYFLGFLFLLWGYGGGLRFCEYLTKKKRKTNKYFNIVSFEECS